MEQIRDRNVRRNTINRNDEIGASATRLAATARPPRSSSPRVTIPFHMRKLIDVEPGEYDRHSVDVSKNMIRLLRHNRSILRAEDGAVELKILAPMFASQFESSPHWSNSNMGEFFAKRRRSQEGISVLPGSSLCRDYSILSINSKPFWMNSN